MSGLINVVRKAKPFFSRVDEAAKALPRNKGTGKEFMTELTKQPGVKKAEIEDRKLKELESLPKMTKEQFIQKLEEKPAPKFEEKTYSSGEGDPRLIERAEEIIKAEAERAGDRAGGGPQKRRKAYESAYAVAMRDFPLYIQQAAEEMGVSLAKYSDPKLQLPGGENYREILLKLPAKRVWLNGEPVTAEDMATPFGRETVERSAAFADDVYKSKHWDDPNVLAHIRVSDRKGPNGEKILHIEEIQSDWHQAARDLREEKIKEVMMLKHVDKKTASDMVPADYGYLVDKSIKELPSNYVVQENQFAKNPQHKYEVFNKDTGLVYGFSGSTPEEAIEKTLASMNRQQSENLTGKVPDAPFKKNWHELAMKRIMDYATEGGYDKVAITPGDVHNKRYQLTNFANAISYHPDDAGRGMFLNVFGKNNDVIYSKLTDEADLPKIIGKEAAERLLSKEPIDGNRLLEGLDLEVGGEGMRGFYDQILPTYINNEYGKYGAKVGVMPIQTGTSVAKGKGNLAIESPILTNLHSIDITPEMREAIKSKGQPLYQAIGAGTAGAAAVPEDQPEFRRGGRVNLSDNLDTMMLELASRRK